MRKVLFHTGEFYHIYNRGVEGRDIFIDNADRYRFLLGMREFNDIKPIFNLQRHLKDAKGRNSSGRSPVVALVCYSLMPNHYHFLVYQLKDEGISRFMHKLGTGYTMYFNKRHTRTGVLFQGVFQSTLISDDSYLMHLSRYIHMNALSLIQPNWKEEGVKDKNKALEFLKGYRWHSLGFWLENKPCLVKLDPGNVLREFIAKKDYEEFLKDWMIGRGEASTTNCGAVGYE